MSYSADEIGNRTFSITQRGYDRAEVELFLRDIARQMRAEATPSSPATADERLAAVVARLEGIADRMDPGATPMEPVADVSVAVPVAATTETAPVSAEAATSTAEPTLEAATAPAAEPVVEPAPSAPAAAAPSMSAPEIGIPSAPPAEVLDDSLPVSEQLEEAKSLLDGVLDDVMGSLRPER